MDTDLDWVMTDLMGVASRRELARCGVSGSRLQTWVRHGALVRTERGLYVDPRRPDDIAFRRRRALAWAGSEALLSHVSGAAAWELSRSEGVDDVHVTVPHGKRVRPLSGVTIHQARYWVGRTSGGWPVVTPRQLAIDLADDGDLDRQRFVVLTAMHRGLLTLDEVVDPCLVPRRALARWATVAQEAQAGARSGAEAIYWRAVTGSGLPEPLLNQPIDAGGRRYVVDALWPDLRLAVEIDGRKYHSREGDFERDRVRQNELHVAGLLLMRFTAEQVMGDIAGVLRVTRDAIRTRMVDLRLSHR